MPVIGLNLMQEHLLQSREQRTFTKATGPRQDEANYEQQAREHKRPYQHRQRPDTVAQQKTSCPAAACSLTFVLLSCSGPAHR